MRNGSCSLIRASLAALLLVIQLAGSSPDLHGWLHGEMGMAQDCASHGGAHGHGPEDSGDGTGTDGCVVILMSGGLTLFHATSFQSSEGRLISVLQEAGETRPRAATSRMAEARAPPVL